jgi:hypothetical protein
LDFSPIYGVFRGGLPVIILRLDSSSISKDYLKGERRGRRTFWSIEQIKSRRAREATQDQS